MGQLSQSEFNSGTLLLMPSLLPQGELDGRETVGRELLKDLEDYSRKLWIYVVEKGLNYLFGGGTLVTVVHRCERKG
jgi:hypothetical protein